MNLHSALTQLFIGIATKLVSKLRQNELARMHEYDTEHFLFQVWIERKRVAQEIVDTRDGFDSGEPAAENEDTCLVRHNCGNLRQEQPVLAEAVRLETTLETGSRVGCAAVRRRRFLRCDRVQPRSDVDRLAGEIWSALLLLLRMWSRGRGPTPRRMDQ